MSIIINLRSTNGGGKSTVMKRFIDTYKAEPIINEKNKVQDYILKATETKLSLDTYILGAYTTPTGGCDGIKTQDMICDRVRKYSALGNVLFEGLLISALTERYDNLAKELSQHKFIFGFLDTPVEVCIERVIQRRQARGNTKPFDPDKSLTGKYKGVVASRRKLIEAGHDVRDIDHTHGFEIANGWLHESLITPEIEKILQERRQEIKDGAELVPFEEVLEKAKNG